jgi:hypothetical protein
MHWNTVTTRLTFQNCQQNTTAAATAAAMCGTWIPSLREFENRVDAEGEILT